MNIVASVFGTVREMYQTLNPATLTGGIDVIVVRQPDGSFQCSPFHVRFGKLGVLRSKEKVVDIEINGEPVNLHMKLGDNGEAFFVEENEDLESEVPAHLCTSPIPLEMSGEREVSTEGPSPNGVSGRKKKRRRKRVRSDNHLRDEGSSSDERESESDQNGLDPENEVLALQMSKSIYYSMSEEPSDHLRTALARDTHAHSDSEQSPNENVFFSRPSSPKSDSELYIKPQGSSGPQMQWNWGGFPTPCQSERTSVHVSSSGPSHFRTIERQDSFDLGIEPSTSCGRKVTVVRPKARTRSLDFNKYSLKTAPLSPTNPPQNKTMEHKQPFSSNLNTIENFCQSTVNIMYSSDRGNLAEEPSSLAHVTKPAQNESSQNFKSTLQQNGKTFSGQENGLLEQNGQNIAHVNEEDNQTLNQNSELSEVKDIWTSCVSEEEPVTTSNGVTSKTEPQDKTRDKRSLGTSDIYLDQLTSMDPEVAALYFPKSGKEASSQPSGAEGSLSGSYSPQSSSSGALDSGTDYLSDSMSFNVDVSMSLCGPQGKEKFMECLVTYQDFCNNPGIIDDPNLVICINSNYYNWAVAAPMVLSMAAFQKNLPKSTVEQLVKDKMSKKSGRWWFPFRRRDLPNNQKNSKEDLDEPLAALPPKVKATLDDVDSDEAAGLGRFATLPSSTSPETLNTAQCISQMYRKSLRLTSKQIEQLNLVEGENQVVFSVTTQYQGTCRCEAAIYLWNWDDTVIISDIDGTITKSDALGHILPTFGKDWTHSGIARLYQKVHGNGYKFLYCSARAIGMSTWTKNYLFWVNDDGAVLPKGPVLLAPSSLFSALHREVIEKKPEVFKVACLSDIRDLFNPHRQPFYAAFGNRTNDAYAYKQVGVPDSKIFTVNPRGELIQEKTKSNKSSYNHLCELAEHFFPSLSAEFTAVDCPDFSSATYWKEPLPAVDLETLL